MSNNTCYYKEGNGKNMKNIYSKVVENLILKTKI
ncbi:hypothetical protein RSJ2_3458 [Clostridium botulinum]|nr:hypothetical protein T257_1889 [Clostridium botulinum CDC_297]AJE13091.1 hypothetical protein T259_566 [Clostridium botulinum CDC_1436]APR01388.1 hypothetical protein RSJ2_3458 [Clostridium botulinum]APU58761.1 hypothetical protein NPD8_649 [Clostridium botulinum]